MSRRLDFATNVLLLLLLSGAVYIVVPLDEYSKQSLADFRPFAGIICGVGMGIGIQRVLNKMRR